VGCCVSMIDSENVEYVIVHKYLLIALP
jgi:hypothetical protein